MSQKLYGIMIKARGPHHEGHGTGNRGKDADNLLSEFIQRLQGLGHEVVIAAFKHEDKTELLVGSPRDLPGLNDLYDVTESPDAEEHDEADETAVQEIIERLEQMNGERNKEHTIASIGATLKTLLKEFRAEVRREVRDDKLNQPSQQQQQQNADAADQQKEEGPETTNATSPAVGRPADTAK